LGQSFEIERFVDEQRLSRFNLNLLVWSFLAMFADGFDISALSFAVPALTRLWQVPPQAFGIALSASLFGILFGALIFGYIGDRFGRRPAIIAGCIIYGVATLAITGAADINQLTALRFVTGIGLGGLMPNSIALTSELSPRRWRATLIVLMFVGITLGGAAPSLVAKLLVPQFGWQILFLIGGGAPLLIALGLRFALPESVKVLALRPNRHAELLRIARRMRPELALPDDTRFHARPAPPSAGTGLGQIFAPGLAPITVLLWICFATALMANFFLNGWLPLIFEQSGLSPGRAAIATGWYHVGGTLGGLVVSVLLDRVGVIVMVVMFALAAPVVAAIGWSGHSYAALTTLVALSGFCVLGAQFGNNASAGLLYPTSFRAKGVGWALAVGRIGSIAGPMVGGKLIGMKLPLRQLFLAPAIPMLVGGVAAAWLAWLCYRRCHGFKLEE
jgi:AAHS family 4-hydroxybenzoate transporter-like MFS transporter